MQFARTWKLVAATALALGSFAPGLANANDRLEAAFDNALGTDLRAPRTYLPTPSDPLEELITKLADGSRGRIGVAAMDLGTGQEVAVLGDQRFPMASTSKIAIAATFMEGVESGKWSLTSEFPLLIPIRSARFSGDAAPVRKGQYLPASELIELMITRSSNTATDALLAAVGGPEAVNKWMHDRGIKEFELTRDIATLVRDDGEFDPATRIDLRDSATPRAMVKLLAGLHKGKWLNDESRAVILGAMERCKTGTRRIPALMPDDVTVAHKTGSLNNTSSDIGIITTPDGRSIAVAIYVTGQGAKLNRETKIAEIARAIHDGYTRPAVQWANARYSTQ